MLLSPGGGDPLYRKAVRASMGAVLEVPFARLARWPDGLREISARRATASSRSRRARRWRSTRCRRRRPSGAAPRERGRGALRRRPRRGGRGGAHPDRRVGRLAQRRHRRRHRAPPPGAAALRSVRILIAGCGYVGQRARARSSRPRATTSSACAGAPGRCRRACCRSPRTSPTRRRCARCPAPSTRWSTPPRRTGGDDAAYRAVYANGVARLARRAGACDRFLLISSTSVYGQDDGAVGGRDVADGAGAASGAAACSRARRSSRERHRAASALRSAASTGRAARGSSTRRAPARLAPPRRAAALHEPHPPRRRRGRARAPPRPRRARAASTSESTRARRRGDL